MNSSFQFAFDAIGTSWSIDIFSDISHGSRKRIVQSVKNRIDDFDKTYSRFRDDSLVAAIARKKGVYAFPPDFPSLFLLYKELYGISDGAFTPLIGNVLADAGYDASYSLQPQKLSQPSNFETTISLQKTLLTVKKPVNLDFGAGGKGYLVDIIGAMLEKDNINAFCIDAGGDILYRTPVEKPLQVGLEHPVNTKQVIGIATLQNQSICGSSGNRRKWKNFHHIIDPRTLSSPEHILATWVIADIALLADSLATCLYFVSAQKLKKYYNFEYVIVDKDFRLERSEGFPAEFYIKV